MTWPGREDAEPALPLEKGARGSRARHPDRRSVMAFRSLTSRCIHTHQPLLNVLTAAAADSTMPIWFATGVAGDAFDVGVEEWRALSARALPSVALWLLPENALRTSPGQDTGHWTGLVESCPSSCPLDMSSRVLDTMSSSSERRWFKAGKFTIALTPEFFTGQNSTVAAAVISRTCSAPSKTNTRRGGGNPKNVANDLKTPPCGVMGASVHAARFVRILGGGLAIWCVWSGRSSLDRVGCGGGAGIRPVER